MKTFLSSQNSPFVKLKIKLDKWREINCLIDTGFSGGLALPKQYEKLFQVKPIVFQKYQLADGSEIEVALFQTEVQFNKHKKQIYLFFSNTDVPLAGIEFLSNLKLTLNLKNHTIQLS